MRPPAVTAGVDLAFKLLDFRPQHEARDREDSGSCEHRGYRCEMRPRLSRIAHERLGLLDHRATGVFIRVARARQTEEIGVLAKEAPAVQPGREQIEVLALEGIEDPRRDLRLGLDIRSSPARLLASCSDVPISSIRALRLSRAPRVEFMLRFARLLALLLALLRGSRPVGDLRGPASGSEHAGVPILPANSKPEWVLLQDLLNHACPTGLRELLRSHDDGVTSLRIH